MAVAAEVVAAILIAVLLLATAMALFVGIMGAVFSEGFERCPSCRHWTLGIRGMAHPAGCPGTLHEHAAHLVQAAVHNVHFRHY